MRVAVTTSADSFEVVAQSFRAVSLEPVPAPCIAVHAVDAAALSEVRALVERIGAVIVTSARTVGIVWGNRVPDVAFVTVGAASTAAVVAAGGRVELEGEGGLADLVHLLNGFSGPAIVFPHATGSDPGLLMGTSTPIHSRPVYYTEPIRPPDVAVDAVAFGSPSAVDGWFIRGGTDGMVVAAIGETTSRRLQEFGVRSDVVPNRPGFAEMAQSLAEYRGVRT